ncbi:50S ribosomal protein L24e [Candidatus Woesearchaeota archaeon]|nr:50S ribosomal protein L24e [Candidatus Woesearchaeota archaeon]
MATCSFCESKIPKGTGKMFVQKDGKILYFCSLKCEKNMNTLLRKPRETRWTFTAQRVKKGKAKEKS